MVECRHGVCVLENKARNSHKPRLEEYVQQGNIRSITYIVRGVPFSSFIQKTCITKYFEEKNFSLRISRVWKFFVVFILILTSSNQKQNLCSKSRTVKIHTLCPLPPSSSWRPISHSPLCPKMSSFLYTYAWAMLLTFLPSCHRISGLWSVVP